MSETCGCARDSGIPCRAVQTLWDAYYEYAGIESQDLCAELGIPIDRFAGKASKFVALWQPDKLVVGGARVTIPKIIPSDMSAREGLLIYHELGHHFLNRDHEFFRNKTRWVPTELDVQVEVWCDNFALAMLLAFFGWEPFKRTKSAHAFLRYGEKIGRPRSDALLAWRIHREMRRPRKNCSLPKSPLILLSDMLLLEYETAV